MVAGFDDAVSPGGGAPGSTTTIEPASAACTVFACTSVGKRDAALTPEAWGATAVNVVSSGSSLRPALLRGRTKDDTLTRLPSAAVADGANPAGGTGATEYKGGTAAAAARSFVDVPCLRGARSAGDSAASLVPAASGAGGTMLVRLMPLSEDPVTDGSSAAAAVRLGPSSAATLGSARVGACARTTSTSSRTMLECHCSSGTGLEAAAADAPAADACCCSSASHCASSVRARRVAGSPSLDAI